MFHFMVRGTYGSNLKPNNKILVINHLNISIEKIINLGDTVAPHGLVATRNGKLWVVCDQQNRLLRINPSLGTIAVVFQISGKGGSLSYPPPKRITLGYFK